MLNGGISGYTPTSMRNQEGDSLLKTFERSRFQQYVVALDASIFYRSSTAPCMIKIGIRKSLPSSCSLTNPAPRLVKRRGGKCSTRGVFSKVVKGEIDGQEAGVQMVILGLDHINRTVIGGSCGTRIVNIRLSCGTPNFIHGLYI